MYGSIRGEVHMKRYNVVLRRGFNNAKVLDTKLALDGKWVKYDDVKNLLNVADTLSDAQAEFLKSGIHK